ncbi:hypothetical protein E3N47_00855 [Campylobacter upsaliensis]|nr:hypothetical protein [Campylobacter upsaliensis]
MLTLKLNHASQAHPTNALATRLCLTPPFVRLALPSHEAKAIPPISRTKAFIKPKLPLNEGLTALA